MHGLTTDTQLTRHVSRRTTRAAVAALALAALALACDDATAPDADVPAGGAVVTFAFTGHPADTLAVQVLDSATIAAARAYVASKQGAAIPVGPIRRGAGVDARYPFHFVPDSVRLAEMAIEVCDGAPMRTAAAVDSLFAWTGRAEQASTTYCPWSAYPIRVADR